MGYVVGVDIGSAFSKAVVVADNELVSFSVILSGANYKRAADEVMKEALAKANLPFNDIAYVVATGSGVAHISFLSEKVTDIACHGKGIFYLFPSVRTVIDIGGQYSKVIRIDDRGKATAFELSEKCAAGSGRLLQVIAHVLQVDLKEIGPLSLKSKKSVDFSTGCAVFAESEAISRVAEGALKEDILAGVHRALAAKIKNLVERVGLELDCALVGGTANDIGLVRSIEEELSLSLLVPQEPQITAALGAALIAQERAASKEK